jgi:hypothetical protein
MKQDQVTKNSALRYPMALALLTAALVRGAEAAPKLVCEEETFNFGEREDTEVVKHAFVLRNGGDEDLVIESVRVSCGCTVADVSSRTLPPGGESALDASVKLQGRRGPQSMRISVGSNDPERPLAVLTMRGTVIVDVGLEPVYLNFGQLGTDSKQSHEVKLLSRDPTVRIVSVTGDHPSFQAVVSTNASGFARSLHVTAQPPFERGFLRAEFTVTTTHPTRPTLRLPVSALLPELLHVIPKEIVLKGQHPAGLTRSLLVRPGLADSVTIRGVAVPDERIQVRIEDIGNGNQRVTLANIPVEAALDGKVVEIETDVVGYERVKVPIRVLSSTP